MSALYIKHILSTAYAKLNGLKIVMDCSNGANSEIAPVILRSLGAEVVAIFNEPNGININNGCGSTHLEALQKKVVEVGANVGIANDGDADRCLVVDENGEAMDGDQIMLICALELMKRNKLHDNMLVTTVMSNVGLHQAMKAHGGKTVKTAVGDRYVLEEMLKHNYSIGGEQSGHIIFSVKNKNGWEEKAAIQEVIKKYQEELGENGKILVRASGTEPLIRIMAEGPKQERLEQIANAIADVVTKELA